MVKFAGAAGTVSWTVDAADYDKFYNERVGLWYTTLGFYMMFSLYLESTTVSGSGNVLSMTWPHGIVAKRLVNGQCFLANAGTWAAGKLLSSASVCSFLLTAEGNFSSSTNNFHVNASGLVEINRPRPRIF